MTRENLKFKNKKEKAFTFIELLAAIIVLAIGVLSVIAVSAKSYAAISLQKNKLIAANLAREGIELVKNVRNENWLYKITTPNSYCNLDSIPYSCPSGRIQEDNNDCDWRCGSKSVAPNNTNFFRLEQSWSYGGNNYFLQNLDYNLNPSKLSSIPSDPNCKDHGATLKIDSDGFYNHTSGADSIFKRLILIKRDLDENGDGNPNNDIQVIVKVCWQERGRDWQEVFVEEHLFNWWKPQE